MQLEKRYFIKFSLVLVEDHIYRALSENPI